MKIPYKKILPDIGDKIFWVQKSVYDANIRAPLYKLIRVEPNSKDWKGFYERITKIEKEDIFEKMKQLRVFELVKYDGDDIDNASVYHVKRLEYFFHFFEGDKSERSNELKKQPNKDEMIYKISYDKWSGEIYINNKKLIKLRWDSVNRIVFEYLYNHPEKWIKKEILDREIIKELQENKKILNHELKKPLSKIAYELGFIGGRKKLFLNTLKNAAMLRIKITKKQFEDIKVNAAEVLP